MATLKKRFIFVLITVFTIIGDQITKNIVKADVIYGGYIELAGKSLILTHIQNTGAFLGFASSFPQTLKNILLLGLPFIIITLLFLYFFLSTKTNLPTTICLALIAGGGISNLYDRFVYKSVTDFLFLDLGFIKTGIFNLADMAVMLGIVILFFYNIRNTMQQSTKEA